MKAQAFLELVGEMLTAQQEYFKDRTQSTLIRAKELEKRVLAVVKAGWLEPDFVATLEVIDGEPGEGIQLGMFMEDRLEPDAPRLDDPADVRPTGAVQANLFVMTEEHDGRKNEE
jgi:hypothetical protein